MQRAEVCASFYKTPKGSFPVWNNDGSCPYANFEDIVYQVRWAEGEELKTALFSERKLRFA